MPESPTPTMTTAPVVPDPPQWRWGRIATYWAAAAVPMAVGAWVLAPRLADEFDAGTGMLRGLVIALTLGLAWQALLVAYAVRTERGSLGWSHLREALWLSRPQSPRTGRTGGRVWWMLVPASLMLMALQLIPVPSGPDDRNLGTALETDAVRDFMLGNWAWFGLICLMLVLNTVVGEELLFRGVLLPRMQAVGGRFAWVWNSVMFALYHVHQPWTMANVLISSTVFSYTTHRYRSAWFGIITHSLQSVLMAALLLGLVVGAV